MITPYGSVSDEMSARIAQGASTSEAGIWEAMFAEALMWRPLDYDHRQSIMRLYYEGNFEESLIAEVRRRFPKTGLRMSRALFNWAKLYAANAAAVFDLPPTFFLERDRERIDPLAEGADGGRALLFDTMCTDAELQPQLAEAERRSKVAKDCFIRVHSDSIEASALGIDPRMASTLFWPNDVYVIPHPSAPSNLATCAALIARVACDEGVRSKSEAFEVWRRAFTTTALPGGGSRTEFGPWIVERVTRRVWMNGNVQESDIEVETIWAKYPHRRLPWIVLRDGIPNGTPYVDADRNLVPLFNATNAGIMAQWFAADMGSASILARRTNDTKKADVAMGAGMMINIPKDDIIESIPQNTDHEGIANTNQMSLSMLAMTTRQRIGAWNVKGDAAPQSGVAMMIEGEPQTKARLESVARSRRPVTDLLTTMAEIHERAIGLPILGKDGVTAGWAPAPRSDFETKGEKVDRAVKLHQEGLISGPRALVMAEVAADEAEATRLVEEAEAESRAKRPSALFNALDTTNKQAGDGGEPNQDDPPDPVDVNDTQK